MTEQELLLTSVLNCRRVDLYLDRPKLSAAQKERLFEMYARRRAGEPVQYITGSCEFFGLDFLVDSRVLIPRPETEFLIETAFEKIPYHSTFKILDLGTGSGNIPVVLAKTRPHAFVTTIDVSPEATGLARRNALMHHVEDRIEFVVADMTEYLKRPESNPIFDLIISNPPYIPTSDIATLPREVQMEPRLALDGGPDGLKFYRATFAAAPRFLKSGGHLVLEIGSTQADALQKIIVEQLGAYASHFFKDYTGKDRVLVIQKPF